MGSTERFGYEWKKFDKIIPEYETQFLKWVYPLQTHDFENKKFLDAGCGIGRNSYWPLTYGASEGTGFDYNKDTIRVAKRNLSEWKNIKIDYESIYDISYQNDFDIVFSIGVIMFLEDPHLAIKNLVNAAKKGGIVLIWVYAYEGNEWIVKFLTPIRSITSRLPLPLTDIIAKVLSIPLYIFLKLIPQSHPYLHQLSKNKFWHIHSIVFDQLIPRVANYWKKGEALSLFESKGLENIQIFRVNENSWTVLGYKV